MPGFHRPSCFMWTEFQDLRLPRSSPEGQKKVASGHPESCCWSKVRNVSCPRNTTLTSPCRCRRSSATNGALVGPMCLSSSPHLSDSKHTTNSSSTPRGGIRRGQRKDQKRLNDGP
ncbi:unnamed protein product [Protopolystoma xenopodis]|uniref:Uncharacterized protein n=1 Tax=Protopolystoma xenopodis TaxID=117903 RepID=A0A3S4ZL20_9PLAT|nr:unnamed protein product [Protopolystoma xenopodis]